MATRRPADEQEFNLAVGARLQAAREEAGFSVNDLASKVSHSAPTISRHETGRIAVGGYQAVEYAAALSISPEWLMFGTRRAR